LPPIPQQGILNSISPDMNKDNHIKLTIQLSFVRLKSLKKLSSERLC